MNESSALAVLPLSVALLRSCLYHLGSRGAPATYSPFAILAAVYCVAMITSAGIALYTKTAAQPPTAMLFLQPAVYILSAGILMIEIGFLFAYRYGAPLGTSALFVNIALAVILPLIGFVFLR